MELLRRDLLTKSIRKEKAVRFMNIKNTAYINKAIMESIDFKTDFVAFRDGKKLIFKFGGFTKIPNWEHHLRRLSIMKSNGRVRGGANATMKDIIKGLKIKDGTYQADCDDGVTVVIHLDRLTTD